MYKKERIRFFYKHEDFKNFECVIFYKAFRTRFL